MLFKSVNREELKILLEDTIIPSCPRHQVAIYKRKFPVIYAAILRHTLFLSDDALLAQRLWHIVHSVWEEQKCSICGTGLLHFDGFAKNYRAHCSTSCSTKDANVQKKLGDTCKAKYGARNSWSRGSIVRKRTEDKRKDLTGYSNPWGDPAIIEKRAVDYEKIHGIGIRNPSQNLAVKAAKRQTHECRLSSQLSKLLEILDLELLSSRGLWKDNKTTLQLKCLKCKTEFESNYYDLYYHVDHCPNCPSNKTQGVSQAEAEVFGYVQSILSLDIDMIFRAVNREELRLSRDNLQKKLKKEIMLKCPNFWDTVVKKRYPQDYEKVLEYTSFLPEKTKFNRRLWHVINSIWEIPKCKECKILEAPFKSFKAGYLLFCSKSCANKNLEVRKKIGDTLEKRTGYRSSWGDPKVQEKNYKTFKERTGYDNNFQIPEIEQKRLQALAAREKRTGYRYIFQEPDFREKAKSKKKEKVFLFLLSQLKDYHLELLSLKSDYIGWTSPLRFKCSICGKIFISNYCRVIYNLDKCPSCPTNKLVGTSRPEKFLFNFANELLSNTEVLRNTKKVIFPLELDIYVPSKRLAIEYDGLYYHSTAFSKNQTCFFDSKYHLNKTIACAAQDIQLIHIFEDEWLFKQEIVKSRLKHLLGVSGAKRIHARKCKIREITSKIKNDFLDLFHIQSKDNSSIKLGAFFQNELVAVMTFAKPNRSKGQKSGQVGHYELSRFCSHSGYLIPGIASKLLVYFKRNYDWKRLYSYADRRWSTGNLYKQLGFEADGETGPNYWYVKGCQRIHRYALRKRPDEPKDVTEEVLRAIEGYSRIYDCGSFRFNMFNK